MKIFFKTLLLGLAFLGVLTMSGCGLWHNGHGYHHYSGNNTEQTLVSGSNGYHLN